ncbi:hypothetical protein CAEBREN_08270 [Caenorhabditis brenneri]|uniref:BTB domain-containing protein n=1 Tax=Caenorhabditis brenneri TaxID=135651 RepID=G0MD32_CAEBE|nr:hypothetical protein CAEBREN_08270 [Caenorhabditis brenneri]
MTTEQVPIKEFTLTNVIRNVSKMDLGINYYTERVNQCNAPWAIAYVQTDTHFSVYVHCEKARGEVDWSIRTRVYLSLTSSDGKFSFKFFNAPFGNRSEFQGYGVREFISMEELRQKFLMNDEVVVEAKIEVLEMTGIEKPSSLKCFDDDEAKNMSDGILLVNDRQFYISKFTLAQQSTYFKSLLFGNFKESKESEITLKDIDSDAFQVYLEVLHMEPALTDSSVENVLGLSQMYDSKNVTRACEVFLILNSNLSVKKKLQIGCQYDLKVLKKFCLDSLKTAADVRACMGCGGLENGVKDLEVLSSLLEKMQSFMRSK